jgi:branched-chain amino acid transport system permease protein
MSGVAAFWSTNTAQVLINAVALGSVYALMAIGIGLVFGVLRIVNFAFGQLIMAGAYTLALTNGLNPVLSIVCCFAVVLGLTLLMDVVAFRPLRRAAPATMLVATFAISLLLYYIALLKFTVLGKTVGTLTGLNHPIGSGALLVRWVWVVDVIAAALALGGLLLLLTRTNLGLHMRAAATDFRTARLLGVRANRVITAAVLLSGVLAATVAVLLTAGVTGAGGPYVTPDYALGDTILVLVGVVVGGLDRLWTATLGGFAIGFTNAALGGFLPSTGSWPFTSGVYLDSALFTLVILTLLLRPSGLFTPRGQRAVERV